MKLFNYLCVLLCLIVYHSEIVYGQLEDALAGSKQLGEPCKIDIHCDTKWARCTGRPQKCDCWENFVKKNNECIAAVQGFCMENSDCSSTLPNSYCDDDKCRCLDTFTMDLDRKTCLSPKRINETCKLEEECKLYLGYLGHCSVDPTNSSSKICACMQNYHPSRYNGSCILNVGLDGICTDSDQCYTPGEIQLTCDDSVCRCPNGYISDDDRVCRAGAEALVQSFIIVLLMLGFTKMF